MRFERLSGLPAIGDRPVEFGVAENLLGREGLVVRFRDHGGEQWIGNFQRGLSQCDALLEHPDGQHVLIVAGGQGYVVDPDLRRAVAIKGDVSQVYSDAEAAVLYLEKQGLSIEALGRHGVEWRTRRISWDGMRNVRIDGEKITGEAWDPTSSSWAPFSVDRQTGLVEGGSFPASSVR